MKWMSLNELREKYLSFFESKNHLRLKSFPLVPDNDKSLLLINSGMAPMKKYFTGEVVPPRNRVTTCQKCIRTPDLDRVGHTARHGTYFEMLGNFSFGDYFKDEAIPWAWEFLTKWLEIPEDKLWPSVYENDDEAYDLWINKMGVPKERVVKLGKEDNFWEHGSGPCGPCSEIYFDRGEKYGCGSPDCKPGCDCDRYMEIWNNVFSQFSNDGNGNYTELANKNIDTGMGLERLACIMQGVDNLFEVDTVRKILDTVCQLSNKKYGMDAKTDISIRVVTDHIRGASFMICDGVLPSNEGRGYVLRRLLRRAARHGKLLGITDMFLCKLCDVVIEMNKQAYPELVEKEDMIKKVISVEEENFGKTIDLGLKMLEEITTEKSGELSGQDAFKLYDTYGFPLDITKDILADKGWTVDEETFNSLMAEQKQRARGARKAADGESWKSELNLFTDVASTEFLGYTENKCECNLVAFAKNGERVMLANEGDEIVVVCNKTVFYAESGGQVGDCGKIVSNGCCIAVKDTVKGQNGVTNHICVVESGTAKVGETAVCEIDVQNRMAIKRNHTAAHLLQAGLRSVLGTHVEQAGQLVSAGSVRFDFTHFEALSAKELQEVELWVNQAIFEAKQVENTEMAIDEAKKKGAMALFGEKYGELVRVVAVEGRSIELCGGTHIENTAKIGLFKIISEASVASGVRRIEAVTGTEVLALINRQTADIHQAASALKLNNSGSIAKKCEQIANELKAKEKEIEQLRGKLAAFKVDEYIQSGEDVGSLKFISIKLQNAGTDAVKSMADVIRTKVPNGVAVIADIKGDGATIAVTAGKEAQAKGILSGKVVGPVAAIADGKGGGKPDFAMAGAKNVAKIDEALTAAKQIIAEMIK